MHNQLQGNPLAVTFVDLLNISYKKTWVYCNIHDSIQARGKWNRTSIHLELKKKGSGTIPDESFWFPGNNNANL